MTAETATVDAAAVYQNGATNGGSNANPNASKNSKVVDRRRRRKQKKKSNKHAASQTDVSASANESDGVDGDSAKENSDPHQIKVEVEYVPEKAELEDELLEEFKKVLEKFSFHDPANSEDNDKKDEAGQDATEKKADSDSDDEEQDNQQKEKGISNKKKKLQRRMKIAELKQICAKPDVVEIWDATSADPKLLVYLKSYRNTVPVPRHWSQKRKYLQGSCCDNHGDSTCMSL